MIFLIESPHHQLQWWGPGQIVLETVVDYKKFFRLQPGEYVQVNKEDEARKTIDIDQTVGAIVLIP